MSGLTLNQLCLRRLVTNLTDMFYRNYRENPFTKLPFNIVNSILSVAWNLQSSNGIRIRHLVQLLESGSLSELNISVRTANPGQFMTRLQFLSEILNSLASGCKNLETLHLLVTDYLFETDEVLRVLRSGICDSIQNILPAIQNLKYLNCSFYFNLPILRKFRNLNTLKLHFDPQQHWYAFLEEQGEDRPLQTHEHLKRFSICSKHLTPGNVPYLDILKILQYCPELISLGLIESSKALSLLRQISPFAVTKLQHCRWLDKKSPVEYPHLVGDAISLCPLIKDLDFDNCNSRSIPCLRNLKHLVYLNITLDDSVSSNAFDGLLREIGSRLMHLSLRTENPMDISLLLQNCPNLESLRIFGAKFSKFTYSSVSLRNLQHLTIDYTVDGDDEGLVFRLLHSCNQLTQLFLIEAYFDDEILRDFLENNSLFNLKLFYLSESNLTDDGFGQLLQNASKLEIINICTYGISNADNFLRVVFETDHRAILTDADGFLLKDEFFEKKKECYQC